MAEQGASDTQNCAKVLVLLATSAILAALTSSSKVNVIADRGLTLITEFCSRFMKTYIGEAENLDPIPLTS